MKRNESDAVENRELKASSNLQLTSGNGNNEIVVKEGFHHGVAVPLTLEEYEKEIAREKDLISKAKKKIAIESSTLKDGISTWILLSGSNNPTARPDIRPAFRIDSEEKKPVKNNIALTTKKRIAVTPPMKTTKPTNKPIQKFNNNKLLTRVKVAALNDAKNETVALPSTTVKPTTARTTRAKRITTQRITTPKTTTITTTESSLVEDDSEEDLKTDAVSSTTVSTAFLVLEAKDADFNLPNDRSPAKSSPIKKSSKTTTKASTAVSKLKKKKISASGTNSTRIKKKSDKKTDTKLSAKKPEKPITTQIYNYLAREVMPTVGVGLVGLVVTAGLATYFLGSPLAALRRSYDITNRKDDIAYDRSDDFGNMQAEEDMFGKVIAGMPENSAYRNNIRVQSYRPKGQQQQQQQQPQYSGYSQYSQSPKYAAQQQQQQQQQLRYRTIGYNDPYNQYSQYAQQQLQQQNQQQAQAQAKSAMVDYTAQQQILQQAQQKQAQQQQAQQTQPQPTYNVDSIELTTSQAESYSYDYEEAAQSYFPQPEQTSSSDQSKSMNIEKLQIDEVLEPQQPQYLVQQQPQHYKQQTEKITIVQAQTMIPPNHKMENGDKNVMPTAASLTMTTTEDEFQSSIANGILASNNNNNNNQFVVGTVVSEVMEDQNAGGVPEHGPRRKRAAIGKSLENNEIDEENNLIDGTIKRQAEVSTTIAPTTMPIVITESTTEENKHEESTTQSNNYTYDINNSNGNNLFGFLRRMFELKLRLGLNFLQNANVAFHSYLKGVEERVNNSPIFNPYIKNNTASTSNEATAKKSNKPYY